MTATRAAPATTGPASGTAPGPQTGQMPLRAIGSEAARNLLTGTTAGGVLAIALAIIGTGLATADALSVVQLRERAAAFASSGAAVRVLSAPGRVDPVACDRLAGSGSIRASGGLVPAGTLTPRATPSSPITTYRVTPGLASVIGVTDTGGTGDTGVWLSTDLARSLGAAPGTALPTRSGTLTVAGTFDWPDDGRDSRLALAVLQPVPLSAAPMDECWADVWPSSGATDDVIRSATFVASGSTEPLSIGQLNNTHGATLDSQGTFLNRPTRFAAPGCLAAGFVLGFVAVRRRRLEYSAALHNGQRRGAQVATALLEVTGWAGGALVMATTALVVGLELSTDTPTRDLLGLILSGPLVGLLGAQLGTLGGLTRVREHHLFRYFKDR